ncbi:uncharacterized protein LOC141904308 [Tubulanus polymorphus]|uniref:uncharacterized protein LOC141904306 n=1 Tax=Tubulanus polymorphus TaxID=672921 RepID=UPI003DA65722
MKAINELNRNKDLIVKPCDKGGAIAIMSQDSYKKEALRQLNDTNSYRSIAPPDTTLVASEIKRIIDDMRNNQEIDHVTWLYLTPGSDIKIPEFYLLPKIHKVNNPGRPILSGNNGPTEKISKYLDYFLRPIASRVSTYIQDTNDFLNKINSLPPLRKDAILVTMDVKSLYTNIPHGEAISSILRSLDDFPLQYAVRRPDKRRFVQFLNLILKRNEFSFGKNEHRLQIEGCAMGSTVSPSLAIIFMHYLETKCLRSAPNNTIPMLYWRYIDDIFSIWTHGEDKLLEFFEHMNQSHRTIQYELTQSREKVPFLDVEVYKGKDFENSDTLRTRYTAARTDAKGSQFTPDVSFYQHNAMSIFDNQGIPGRIDTARRSHTKNRFRSHQIDDFKNLLNPNRLKYRRS